MCEDERQCVRCGIAVGLVDIDDIVICEVCLKHPDIEDFIERFDAERRAPNPGRHSRA